jgi:hypothetical protein
MANAGRKIKDQAGLTIMLSWPVFSRLQTLWVCCWGAEEPTSQSLWIAVKQSRNLDTKAMNTLINNRFVFLLLANTAMYSAIQQQTITKMATTTLQPLIPPN